MTDTPYFSSEQMAWLTDMLTPECCHVSGTHDPMHAAEGRYVCDLQRKDTALRLIEALGIEDETGLANVKNAGCLRCRLAREDRERTERIRQWQESNGLYCPSGHSGDMAIYENGENYFIRCNYARRYAAGLRICGYRVDVPVHVTLPPVEVSV